MENKIIVGNLKMNMTAKDVDSYLNEITNKINNKRVIICPSNIYIPYFLKRDFDVGVQNIYHKLDNCTGEISPIQLKSIGIKYSIIGHSERKKNLNETDIIINKKIKLAMDNGIVPIICIGETKEEKDMLKTNIVLKRQIKNYLLNLSSNKFYLAYEPIWAIGNNEILDEVEIKKTIDYIKSIVKNLYNLDVKVLYGGSVTEKNIEKLNNIPNVDGFLIGTCSTHPNEFLKLVEVVVGQ